MTKEEFLKDFQTRQELKYKGGYQKWWTQFVFHYNDIHNIVSILNSGKLYSRNKTKSLNILKTDIANDDVIKHTDSKVDKYARFYFGARTPTLYWNEGLIPKDKIRDNAHCPVPIFLLFDFIKILSMDNIWFSNGNMSATNPEVYNDINNLEKLEWKYIYHREPLEQSGYSRHINYCRNAEVLVKDELSIYDSLKWICVRSKADKDTLLNLVDETTKEIIKDKIKIFTSDGLFHNKRLFINEVILKEQQININFTNFNNQEFMLNGIAKSLATGKELDKSQVFNINSNIYFKLDELDVSMGIHFILSIDENKVYDNVLFNINEVLV
ncbi:DarT ssDNA thymidine ADP-ribosyltransferase family protein [Sulfurimonas sp.]|uniref:DarT ssDNA thymidine ADP-ribosyltransferase family protein n=1 Tax=Sulfurimonas sp. TaxID=2022749 RepID=UPI002AB29DB8|nr:DarT ssDNA thymidine ADP-ribosyltransferase family protein [Sulfurimonas sp.]